MVVTTTKAISRGIFGILLGLAVLSLIVRGAGADDATDWANQQAQAQRERDEWYRQQEQAQREREQAERDQRERDEWYRQQAQAQAERDREQAARDWEARQKEWDDWWKQRDQAERERQAQEQAQRDRDQAARDWEARQKEWDDWWRQREQSQKEWDDWWKQQEKSQREWDDWWNRQGYGAADSYAGSGLSAAEIAAIPLPKPTAQVRPFVPALPQQRLARQNPAAFQQMVRQHQARVRQQILLARQEMVRERREPPQMIQNPFVESPPLRQGHQDSGSTIIQNPYVSLAK